MNRHFVRAALTLGVCFLVSGVVAAQDVKYNKAMIIHSITHQSTRRISASPRRFPANPLTAAAKLDTVTFEDGVPYLVVPAEHFNVIGGGGASTWSAIGVEYRLKR